MTSLILAVLGASFVGCFGAIRLYVWLDSRKTAAAVDEYDADDDFVEPEEEEPYDYWNDIASDGEADGDALASAGVGTDEDYGCYGGDEW